MSPEPGARAYRPEPIRTDGVQIPPELATLTEMLAQNAHDVWASQRLAQGWTWGPSRDDARKQHPCLIPFEQLADSEKDIDRAAALETIKVILVLGFSISRPAPPG
jgi:ryanodine receptor 2